MLVSHGAMIMVIDGAKMSLFRNRGKDSSADLELVENAAKHAASTAEIGSDKPGRTFSSKGNSRSAYETTDYHQSQEDEFAKVATQQLNALAHQSHLDFIVIAAPRILGVMRRHYNADLRKQLIAEIDKDYARRTAEDIAQLLQHHSV